MTTLIPVIEENEATGEIAEAYARYRRQFGRETVPGILKCFATHPALLQQMLALAPTLLFTDGHLTRTHKEMIATFVSGINDCEYCLDSHASFLQTCGGSQQVIASLAQGNISNHSLDGKERVLLNFVHKVSIRSHTITSLDIQTMKDAGWDSNAIAEAVHLTGLFAFFNRVANAFGLASQHLLNFDPFDSTLKDLP